MAKREAGRVEQRSVSALAGEPSQFISARSVAHTTTARKAVGTTIARQLVLGAETGLPFAARNDLKETVFD
jgi:hypothetical protein